MFSDYKEAVVKTYKNKKESGLLSINLERPTPAKLRDECLLVIAERFSLQEDEKALRAFFGTHFTAEEYAQTIRFFDIDKFRPLVNFLKRETLETDDKNIELLAWLLAIKPRPYKLDFNHGVAKPIIDIKEDSSGEVKQDLQTPVNFIESDVKQEKPDILNPVKNVTALKEKKKFGWNAALIFGIISLSSVFIFFIFQRSMNHKDCMYWKDDHYESVDCNVKNPKINIIAADEFKLLHFKKINKIDTLTEDCIGKIWYSKIDKNVDFFTIAGMHPEHPEKSLKLVTKHIYEEYILKDKKP
ncbi:hypothetical protein [Pedobacter alpinus]|uniref:CCDC81-like prokaryotic HU domain-containing protein n=1 Tax=Pedobacter alpinus TaxID=1590643 RepID=A0ABW5TWL9_9SPHI